MSLAGLALGPLLAVLGGAAALTVVLYLLKQRRKRVAVPFLPLWEALLGDRQASRLFARLRHLISLLLSLVLVALLVLALGDPRADATFGEPEHVVVVVDAGLTMRAKDVAGGRLQAALSKAREIVAAAGPGVRMLVAQMDASTTPLSPMTDERRDLLDALERVRPSYETTKPELAYRLALDVLRGRSRPSLIVLSDTRFAPDPELEAELARSKIQVRFEPLGKRSDEVAISAFAARRYPLDKNRSEVLLELQNASAHREHVTLTLLGDGAPVDVQPLELEPGARLRRVYDDLAGVRQTLEARIQASQGHDDLAATDRAYAVLAERRRARVLCVTPGNRYLEAALLLDEYLDVDVLAPASYRSAESYDAVIFDRHVPEEPPGKPAIYIHPAGQSGAGPLRVLGELERPRFEQLDRDHPVLRFTVLRDVNVSRALHLKAEPGDDVLAADARGPLIVAGTRAGAPFVALAFELRESDLPLRVAWPLLLLQTLDWFAKADQGYVAAGTVGEVIRLRWPEAATATLAEPGGVTRELTVADGELDFVPERPGFHRVRSGDRERVLAVNVGDASRDLSPPRLERLAGRAVKRPEVRAQGPREPPWTWLLLAVFVLLTAEWISYQRRWTV